MDEQQRNKHYQKYQTINALKSAEQWIIDTLQMDGKFKTLDEAGIGRKYLEVYGLTKDSIDRLYKGLYVYSKGFHELLNQCTDEQQPRISVWKVFLIMIERYNYSGYELLLKGVIEQHQLEIKQVVSENILKQQNEQQLEETIDKLQQTISNNKLEHQAIVTKLQKQLDLINNKYLLADSAAEQELEKRYKLENKTGQIQDIYQEMYHKYLLMIQDVKSMEQQLNKQNDEIVEIRIVENKYVRQIQELTMVNASQHESITEINQKLTHRDTQITQQQLTIKNLQQQLYEQGQQQRQSLRSNKLKQIIASKNCDYSIQINALMSQNEEFNRRLKQYDQQIEEYLTGKQTSFDQKLNEVQNKLSQSSESNVQLFDRLYKAKNKKNKLKTELAALRLDYDMIKQKSTLNNEQLANLESSSQFHQQNNSKMQQYIERLTQSIKKLESNEEILNGRIKSQFQTIESLSEQVEKQNKSYQSQIDSSMQQLLCKSIQHDELIQNMRQFKHQAQKIEEGLSKELLMLQVSNDEMRQQSYKDNEEKQQLELNKQLLMEQMEKQKSEYQEYIQKRDEYIRVMNQQAIQITKLEKDNTKQHNEIHWLETQNQGYQDKLKKQQLIIKEQLKELEKLKYDYSNAQRTFEDMKIDYDNQIQFYQHSIKDVVQKNKALEQDVSIGQQQLKQQTQTIVEQNEKIKRFEIALINKEQDVKLLQTKLNIEERKQQFQNRLNHSSTNQFDQLDDFKKTLDQDGKQLIQFHPSLQEMITQKIIEKFKLRKQKTEGGTLETDGDRDNDSDQMNFSQLIGRQLNKQLTLETIINNVTDSINIDLNNSTLDVLPSIIQHKDNEHITSTDTKQKTNHQAHKRSSKSVTHQGSTALQGHNQFNSIQAVSSFNYTDTKPIRSSISSNTSMNHLVQQSYGNSNSKQMIRLQKNKSRIRQFNGLFKNAADYYTKV